MELGLRGKVAAVTGGSEGIGRATVQRLVEIGDRVVAVDSCQGEQSDVAYPLATREELDELVAACGDGVIAHVADVRDRGALQAAVGLALDTWGRLDATVAAAAVIAGGRPLWETSDADLNLLWDVDVRGVWNTAAVTVPPFHAGPDPQGARFVAVASAAASHGLFGLAAYNATKHAVVGVVKGLSADLVGTGVTACAVSPGSTRTRMLAATAELYDLLTVDDFAGNQLLRRLIDPAEVAATVAFCCSREAAVLNGSVVQADGGFSP